MLQTPVPSTWNPVEDWIPGANFLRNGYRKKTRLGSYPFTYDHGLVKEMTDPWMKGNLPVDLVGFSDVLIYHVGEMRIVRRKYNVGRIVRNHWVVGDIQIGINLVFVDVMDDGSSCFAVIQKYVQRGVACTDIWRGYNDLTIWATPKKRSTPCEVRGSDHRIAYAMHWKRLVSLEGSNSLRAPVKH